MKRTIIFILCLAVVITTFIILKQTVFVTEATETVSKTELTVKDVAANHFLNDKKAVVYLSTTADQDFGNSGMSSAVFIDQGGEISSLAMKGLELGSVALNSDTVFLEEKSKVRIVGDGYKEFSFPTKEHTGELTGFLDNQQLFFSIYNSGFQQSGYASNVRYGNKEGFQQGTIPAYIATSGVIGDEVAIVTQDVEKNSFDLKRVHFGSDVTIEQIAALDIPKGWELNAISSVVGDDTHYYMLMNEFVDDFNTKVWLFIVDKKTTELQIVPFLDYKNVENLSALNPYNMKNALYLYDDELFFINGYGDVYSYHTKSKEIQNSFSLENPSKEAVRHNEETYFKKDALYVIRYDVTASTPYRLEKYSLRHGMLEETLPLHNFELYVASSESKRIYSYDLKIISD